MVISITPPPCITSRVAMRRWSDKDQLGGYIWHTTGSEKSLTSFKSAQLIAETKDADKVVFLMDRGNLAPVIAGLPWLCG